MVLLFIEKRPSPWKPLYKFNKANNFTTLREISANSPLLQVIIIIKNY